MDEDHDQCCNSPRSRLDLGARMARALDGEYGNKPLPKVLAWLISRSGMADFKIKHSGAVTHDLSVFP